MKVVGTALLALLGLLVGAAAGSMAGAMVGLVWVGLHNDCGNGHCAVVALFTTYAGVLIGGLGGAWLLAR